MVVSPPRTDGRRLRPAQWAALAVLWLAIVIPYVVIGPDDFEEYKTAVTTTVIGLRAMLDGAWPFWSLDMGLGMPQPLRFQFITHPLAPLCAVTDCHAVLRGIASLHVLLGAVFLVLIARRLTGSRGLALLAGVTFCVSSSVVQPMFVDDWPITALNEASVPILLYATLALGDGSDRRRALLWTLVLGGLGGLLLSMAPVVLRLAILACVSLAVVPVRRRLPWLAAAGVITLAIGAGHLHHIYTEFVQTPPHLFRSNHDDFSLGMHLWSLFVRPFGAPPEPTWRTAFLGPPFAVAGAVAALVNRGPAVRPLQVGLALGIVGFFVPPAWLFDVNTAQWTYRTELNVFGILLAVQALDRLRASRYSWAAATLAAAQVCFLAAAFAPPWYATFARAFGLAAPGRHALVSPGIAEELQTIHRAAPGRFVFTEAADAAVRDPEFHGLGLAANQLPQLGVPTLSAIAFGVTTDALYPLGNTLEGVLLPDDAEVRNPAFLNVLGVRYVAALGSEPVAPGLDEIRRLPGDLRIYSNQAAWPAAFFVDRVPVGRLSRLPGCSHDRFLCADFSEVTRRDGEPLDVTTLGDGLELAFPPSPLARDLVVTQWNRAGWKVTAGRASIGPPLDQLIRVRVEAGEQAVRLQFRPYGQAVLSLAGIVTELAVAAAMVVVLLRSRTAGEPALVR